LGVGSAYVLRKAGLWLAILNIILIAGAIILTERRQEPYAQLPVPRYKLK
jgi:hypothetical protein